MGSSNLTSPIRTAYISPYAACRRSFCRGARVPMVRRLRPRLPSARPPAFFSEGLMNWLGRWLLGTGSPSREQVTAEPVRYAIRCPKCSSERPAFTLLDLRTYWIRDGVVFNEVTGYRVQCQECAHTYSIDARGTFKHNRNAYPMEPQPQAQGQRSEPPQDPDMDPHPIPIPYSRPEV